MTTVLQPMCNALSLLLGWLLDRLFGDPPRLPHPVVLFGRVIAFCQRRLNRGGHRRLKGGVMAMTLIIIVYGVTRALLYAADAVQGIAAAAAEVTIQSALIFYCLAGTTLIREVREVFAAVDRSLSEGRRRVARIVGRDTEQLSAAEVRTAALETLAENLSDGVVAPLFWLFWLGVPGMMAYKMVNTLDSMIGYRTERYRLFGAVAARLDDVANYLPARLTAVMMVILSRDLSDNSLSERLRFLINNGNRHASPNSGWPEAALASILDCRFGGAHRYFGERVAKPYIGTNDRGLTAADMERAVRVNRRVETVMIIITACYFALPIL